LVKANSKQKSGEMSDLSVVVHGGHPPKEPRIGHPGSGFAHTSTFQLPYVDDLSPDLYDQRNEDYGRQGHPYAQILEEQVAALEHANYVTVYGSGMAAITAICISLQSNDLILAEQNLYGCTVRLWRDVLSKFGVRVKYLDFTDSKNVELIMSERPRLVWIESPTNPLMKIIDIEAVAKVIHQAGGTLVVDNSLASGFLQRPLDLGADVSVISLTKYIEGQSSAMGGAACTNDESWGEKLLFQRKAVGLHLPPDEAERISLGLKTIALRMEKHSANALAVARYLEKSRLVRSVRYPFLESHPQYDLAVKQMRAGSGIVTAEFDVPPDRMQQFMRDLYPLFKKTHSLGSVACSVSLPGTMSHASLSDEQREAMQISPTTLRFSIGIEPVEDIIAQIEFALEKASH
jgi:cystathionine beta-lyase/cystathionine gamma-synthase